MLRMRSEDKETMLDWNHVYLLAWWGPDGKSYLTSWSDTEYTRENYVNVVVTGPDIQQSGPPIWDAPANVKPNNYGVPSHPYTEYQLHKVGHAEDWEAKARKLGGVRAKGWYIEKGIDRKWHGEVR